MRHRVQSPAVVLSPQERFLAILSHDLRMPLGAIITSTRFMLDAGGLEEPNRTLVARASSSARRMNQMVLDLVEFTRTRLGDAIPVVRAEAGARRLGHDVVQALTNLVGNAVQHGARGTPIRVSAHGLVDEVAFSVHNEGPPIPAEQQATIFEEGQRVGARVAAADRRHQGLGLYIVERIVAAHGGTVSLRSTSGEGTTFTIRLPRTA